MRQGHQLGVSIEHTTEVTTLHVRGEIDLATLPALEDGLTATLAASSICVDLTALTFLDARGLDAIARASTDAARRGAGFVVRGACPFIQQLFALVSLDDLLDEPRHQPLPEYEDRR
jgi:anti-anti-sigma factor